MTASYRILIPSEYHALLDTIEKERLRIVVETMMNTGMRYSELVWLGDWMTLIRKENNRPFDPKNNAIILPEEATKTKRERVIHLTPAFSKRLFMYLREHRSLEVPSRRVMDENLKRWWMRDYSRDAEGFCNYNKEWYPTCKTFRKSWESLLLAAGYPSMAVALSQGHSELISYYHYANLDPRLKSEMDEVRKLTEGWGT